jgi:hypothetical protein
MRAERGDFDQDILYQAVQKGLVDECETWDELYADWRAQETN